MRNLLIELLIIVVDKSVCTIYNNTILIYIVYKGAESECTYRMLDKGVKPI